MSKSPTQMSERVAVIGGGVAGLVATKTFLEDGFDVTSYETRAYLGGLWRDTYDSSLSVQSTTAFNSSKFRSAFSDFPFPESADTYPTAAQLYDYLNNYADHFDLRRHYCLSTRVQQILRDGDDGWLLEVIDPTTGTLRKDYYDRVCVATGTFSQPRFPKLDGIEKFSGQVLHSIDFHGAEPFRGKNVFLVGMHATAQDITSVLRGHAKHVYLSHRHGVMCLPRYLEDGATLDSMSNLSTTLLQLFMERWLPTLWFWLVTTMCSKISLKAFGTLPSRLGLQPYPSIAIATPVIADVLMPHLQSGFAEPTPAIQQITGPNSVTLTDGRTLTNIDAIIYCTGYHTTLPDSLIPKSTGTPTSDLLTDATDKDPVTIDPATYNPYPNGPNHPPTLYMNTFPMSPSPQINTTLSFLSHAALTLPGFTQQELQALAISQIWLGHKHLPSLSDMHTWHSTHLTRRSALASRHGAPTENSTFYTCMLPFPEYFSWLNSTANTGVIEHFGGVCNGLFNYRAWRLWWYDREMWELCMKGVLTGTVFRVFETGGRKALGWEEVRGRLRRDNEVFERAREKKKRGELMVERKGEK